MTAEPETGARERRRASRSIEKISHSKSNTSLASSVSATTSARRLSKSSSGEKHAIPVKKLQCRLHAYPLCSKMLRQLDGKISIFVLLRV